MDNESYLGVYNEDFVVLLINFISAILNRPILFINLARSTMKSKIRTFGPFVLSNIQEGNSVGPETKELSDLFDKKKLGIVITFELFVNTNQVGVVFPFLIIWSFI